MGDKSGIEWTDATWNPVIGCSHASAGCANCYAESLAGTRLAGNADYAQVTRRAADGRPRFNGVIVDRGMDALLQPLRWKKPRIIFVNSMGDLYHKNTPRDVIDKVHAVMTLAHWHRFLILTKRAKEQREYVESMPERTKGRYLMPALMEHVGSMFDATNPKVADTFFRAANHLAGCHLWPLPNVGNGVSVENEDALWRVGELLRTPSAMRFLSLEPLLGPVGPMPQDIHWVIAGGESGPGARPAHPDWFRSVRDQCQAAGVAFHFKQWGECAPSRDLHDAGVIVGHQLHSFPWGQCNPQMARVGKRAAGRLLDGVEHNERPEWFFNHVADAGRKVGVA